MVNAKLNMTALLLTSLLLAACAGTKIDSTWTDPDATAKPMEYLAVYVAAPVSDNRKIYEKAIADELTKTGIRAVPMSRIKGLTGRITRETVETVLAGTPIDGVITVFLTNVERAEGLERERYDYWYTISDQVYGPYLEAWEVLVDKHDYEIVEDTIFLESSLVDFRDKHLVWRMYTETKDPQYRNVNQELANRITNQLRNQGLIAARERGVPQAN